MAEFRRKTASNQALANRRPVFGAGINDAWYAVNPVIDGRRVACPFYRKWHDVIRRARSAKLIDTRPTYAEVTVCKEWLVFSAFLAWMENKKWEGLHLDKDFKVKGNKEYAPDKCLFISAALNSLLTNNKAKRGKYLLGVSFNKKEGKFRAQINIKGKVKNLGRFFFEEEAHLAYKLAKNQELARQSRLPEHSHLKNFFEQHLL